MSSVARTRLSPRHLLMRASSRLLRFGFAQPDSSNVNRISVGTVADHSGDGNCVRFAEHFEGFVESFAHSAEGFVNLND